ncbi:MAG: hypothetical protein KG012_13960 [Deltaproteobacteria bacterium]|nr:hypothetical protein [Deltaproteobacteria bacterium]
MRRLIFLVTILFLVCLLVGHPSLSTAASQFTPLPLELRITPPSLDLPKNLAGFSGTWYGVWDDDHPTTLIVEKIEPPTAIAIYSRGKCTRKECKGWWRRYEWKIEPGRLEVDIQESGEKIIYFLSDDGEKLEGEYRRPSKSQINYVTMQRQPPTSTVTFSAEGTPTPLPVNIKIIPPTSNISSNIAAFSGIWQGVWDNGRATTLVVEKIEPPEAIAIYSWGPWKKQEGGWRRHIGMIDPGRLILSNPETELNITFLLSKDGQALEGTWQKGGGKKLKATMRRR